MAFQPSFSLAEVLAVAKIHPFYNPEVKYPPGADVIKATRQHLLGRNEVADLLTQPLLWKRDLYSVIGRLIADPSPLNTFRQSVYTSTTGGGSSSKPLFFATDVHENRNHRAAFGRFLRTIGLIEQNDWVLTTHSSGELYRSLDLTLEILENAGASVLAAGHHMSPASVVKLLIQYHINVLSGDSSQVVSMVHYISTLTASERDQVKINKIIYTSEGLSPSQRAHIRGVLGSEVKICSFLGSAEGGPYAASSPSLIEAQSTDTVSYQDFVVDNRITKMEILPSTVSEDDANQTPQPLKNGEQGVIAQTSFTRLRNPVVRYITGDVGSLHELPEKARAIIPESDWKHMYILRLQGRDRRFSFEWNGCYFEFRNLDALMNDAKFEILQWQVILDKMELSKNRLLEIRILAPQQETNSGLDRRELIENRIRGFFQVDDAHGDAFRLTFVDSIHEFDLSTGGRKVVKFIDRFSS